MGWVIRDPRIIWWGGEGGVFGPPRISDPRTAYHTKGHANCEVRQWYLLLHNPWHPSSVAK